MANVAAVIFDYYETLAEISLATRERMFDDLARQVGFQLLPGEAYRDWRELTTDDRTLRLGGQSAPLDGSTPPFRTFQEVWLARSRELFRAWEIDIPGEVGLEAYVGLHANAPLYPEVQAVLAALRGYGVGVLSDADSDFLDHNIRRHGLTFDVVITSEEMQAYKPHVSMFRTMCGRLGVQPSEAIHVGDSPWADVEGARHAGLESAWVNRYDASWPEGMEPPPVIVTSLEELVALVEGSRA